MGCVEPIKCHRERWRSPCCWKVLERHLLGFIFGKKSDEQKEKRHMNLTKNRLIAKSSCFIFIISFILKQLLFTNDPNTCVQRGSVFLADLCEVIQPIRQKIGFRWILPPLRGTNPALRMSPSLPNCFWLMECFAFRCYSWKLGAGNQVWMSQIFGICKSWYFFVLGVAQKPCNSG